MRKKVLIASIMMSIVSVFLVVCGIVGMKFFNSMDNINKLLTVLQEQGMKIEVPEEAYDVFVNTFAMTVRVMCAMTLIFGVIILIFTLFVYKDMNSDYLEFKGKKVKHVFYIVICFFSASACLSNYGTIANATLSVLKLLPFGMAIASAILLLVEINKNNKAVNGIIRTKATPSPAIDHENVVLNEENTSTFVRDEITNQTEVVEEKPQLNQEELDEVFKLIAKLEEDHRNGLIDDEEYERMKKTLFSRIKQ